MSAAQDRVLADYRRHLAALQGADDGDADKEYAEREALEGAWIDWIYEASNVPDALSAATFSRVVNALARRGLIPLGLSTLKGEPCPNATAK